MESLSSLFKKEHMSELVLAIVFIIYLILGLKTPEPIANLIDTLVGKVVLVLIVIYMFFHITIIVALSTITTIKNNVRINFTYNTRPTF